MALGISHPQGEHDQTTKPGAVSHKVCILEGISSFVPTYRPNQSDITRLETHSLAVLGNSFSHIKSLPRNPGLFLDLVIVGLYSTLHDIAGGWFTMIHEVWMRFVAKRFVPKFPPRFTGEANFTQKLEELTSLVPRSSQKLVQKIHGSPSYVCWFILIPETSFIYIYIYTHKFIYIINIRIIKQ